MPVTDTELHESFKSQEGTFKFNQVQQTPGFKKTGYIQVSALHFHKNSTVHISSTNFYRVPRPNPSAATPLRADARDQAARKIDEAFEKLGGQRVQQMGQGDDQHPAPAPAAGRSGDGGLGDGRRAQRETLRCFCFAGFFWFFEDTLDPKMGKSPLK